MSGKVLKASPKKNINNVQLDPIAHRNLVDSYNSLDLSDSMNSKSNDSKNSKKPKSDN